MTMAEKTKTLAPEQYDSRQNHRATAMILSVIHKLPLQCRGMEFQNPSLTVCSLLFKMPTSAFKLVIVFLPTPTVAQIGILPMHGVGQGNGAGPANWAIVSTSLLNMLRSKGLGCHFISPILKTCWELHRILLH
jgi:hypothetical protein